MKPMKKKIARFQVTSGTNGPPCRETHQAHTMLGKKILKMTPPSIQRFDLEDTGKLAAIVAASEMTREYLIKQKILPDHINI